MRLLVTGAGGLLGREAVGSAAARGHGVFPLGRADLDVTDAPAVRAALQAARPDAVLHLAAYTAVDRAEAEAAAARAVNSGGTRNVAEAAAAVGAALLYVSTDYVFDGAKRAPYQPDDEPRPLSVYGATKLEGERAALDVAPEALVVRTSWLYGAGGRNFVTSVLERARTLEHDAHDGRGGPGGQGGRGGPLRVVDDQTGAPTWARQAAGALLDLLERGARGVWHVAGGGAATWLELAREAFRLCGLDVPVVGVSSREWGAAAPRPPYSLLDVSASEALLGRRMTPWKEALAAFLDEERHHATTGGGT